MSTFAAATETDLKHDLRIYWINLYQYGPRTITVFPPALLALLIPNTTANHTITYTYLFYLY